MHSACVLFWVMAWHLLNPQQLQLAGGKVVVIGMLGMHWRCHVQSYCAAIVVRIGAWMYEQYPWGNADSIKLQAGRLL